MAWSDIESHSVEAGDVLELSPLGTCCAPGLYLVLSAGPVCCLAPMRTDETGLLRPTNDLQYLPQESIPQFLSTSLLAMQCMAL